MRRFLLFLCVLPFFAKGQDSLVVPADYTPYYQWDTLPDSLYMAYQAYYPEKWQKDSIYFARYNKAFIDSILNDSIIGQALFFWQFKDTSYKEKSLRDAPLFNTNSLRAPPAPKWVYAIVLLILCSLVFLKYANLRYFSLLFLSILNPKYCDEALREHDTPVNIFNLMATLLCALAYSIVFCFLAKQANLIQELSSGTFLFIFLAIAMFFLVRFISIMLAAAILETEYTYGVLVQTTVSGNMWLALIVLPVLAFMQSAISIFSISLVPFYLALASLVYLFAKQVRVFVQIAPSFPHSIVYLIFSLCALEIAPYLAIFKLILQKTG